MKKYLVIAALLGAFALASASQQAQAQAPAHGISGLKMAAAVTEHDMDPSDGEAASDDAAAADDTPPPDDEAAPPDDAGATPPQSKQDSFDDAREECTASSEAIKGAKGGDPTAKEIKEAYNTCMKTNGFNKEMIKKMESENNQ